MVFGTHVVLKAIHSTPWRRAPGHADASARTQEPAAVTSQSGPADRAAAPRTERSCPCYAAAAAASGWPLASGSSAPPAAGISATLGPVPAGTKPSAS